MSARLRKPRGDAVLKTLPPARQEAIFAHLSGHKIDETLAWLKTSQRITTSRGALSNFYSWYGMREKARRREAAVNGWLECEKLEHPELTEAELFRRGQRKFSIIALAEEDAGAWSRIKQLGIKRDELALARERFHRETCELFLKWRADQRAVEIADGGASNADKINALGQLMFGEVWKTDA